MVVSGMNTYDKMDGKFVFRPMLKKQLEEYGIGIISTLLRAEPWSKRTYGTGIELEEREDFVNSFQKFAIENSRLGIPVLLDLEASHGMQALGSVVYPLNICTGYSFITELYGRMTSLIARELFLSGNHIGFMTILEMGRDSCFGRTEESFGEDPLLISRMAASAAKSFKRENVSICAKHYIAHGGASGGHMSADVCIGIRELREIHFPPAKAATDAVAELVMIAYNSIDGIPCIANKRLITDILRDEFGFEDIVMSDDGGLGVVRELVPGHSDCMAAAVALNSGTDVSLGDNCGIFL